MVKILDKAKEDINLTRFKVVEGNFKKLLDRLMSHVDKDTPDIMSDGAFQFDLRRLYMSLKLFKEGLDIDAREAEAEKAARDWLNSLSAEMKAKYGFK